MPRKRGGLSDIDYEHLAQSLANTIWNTTTTTITTDNTSNPVTPDPNMFRVHDIVQELPEPLFIPQDRVWRFTQTITGNPTIEDLQTRVAELEKTVFMMGKLLDETIRRFNPTPDKKRKQRSIFIEQEEERADAATKK